MPKDIEWKRVYNDLYVVRNMSLSRIACELCVGKTTVARNFAALGLKTRNASESKLAPDRHSDADIREIYHEDYIGKHLTIALAGDLNGVSRSVLCTRFKELGLPAREQAEAMAERDQRRMQIIQNLNKDYCDPQRNRFEVIKDSGLSHSALLHTFHRNDLPIPRPKGATLTDKDKLQIMDMYTSQHKSPRQVAASIGNSPAHVRKILKRAGVATRNLRDGINKSLINSDNPRRQSRKIKNERFFDEWTEASCYVLGLLWSDGCLYISPENRARQKFVSFTSKDKELVDLVADLLRAPPNAIDYRERKGNAESQWILTFSGPDAVIDRLEKLGMTSRKAFGVTIPIHLPDSLIRHFVRGYIDGDGCFCRQGNGVGFSLPSRSLEILKQISFILYKQAKVGRTIESRSIYLESDIHLPSLAIRGRPDKSGVKIYTIETAARVMIERLFDYLYKDSDPRLNLKRKKLICGRFQ